jgi:hypothetical protein
LVPINFFHITFDLKEWLEKSVGFDAHKFFIESTPENIILER